MRYGVRLIGQGGLLAKCGFFLMNLAVLCQAEERRLFERPSLRRQQTRDIY